MCAYTPGETPKYTGERTYLSYSLKERSVLMSFPNIPDIEPVIDMDSCDAVNLLLSSIAM